MGCAPSQDAAQLGQLTASGERRVGAAAAGCLLLLHGRESGPRRHKKEIVCALGCLFDRARSLMATFLRRNRYNSRRQEIHGRVFVCWLTLHRPLLLLIPSIFSSHSL